MDAFERELRELRLELVDRLEPYGIKGKDLIRFNDELIPIVRLPSKRREKKMCELAEKIRTYYKKTKRAEKLES